MPAMVAVDPGEAVLRIAAFEESSDDIFLDATPEAAVRLQLGRMPGGTLVQRGRARRARPENRPAEVCDACVHPCMPRITPSNRTRAHGERRDYRVTL